MSKGNILRLLMEKVGYNQIELAKKSGVHRRTIQRILAGHEMKEKSLKKIANTFGVTVSELIGETTRYSLQPQGNEHPIVAKLRKFINAVDSNDPTLEIIEKILDKEINAIK